MAKHAELAQMCRIRQRDEIRAKVSSQLIQELCSWITRHLPSTPELGQRHAHRCSGLGDFVGDLWAAINIRIYRFEKDHGWLPMQPQRSESGFQACRPHIFLADRAP